MNTTKIILILSANPKNTARLRLDEEVREIEEGLKRSKNRDQFNIISKWAIRLKDLRRAMLDYEPQIVHFCGHGEIDGLMVEDENGDAVLVNPIALEGLFEHFTDTVECVIFNACYSQIQAESINKHINYVIGMRKSIQDKTAIEFAIGFYDALGAGKSIKEAFKFGCNGIQLQNIPEHLVPILQMKEKKETQEILAKKIERVPIVAVMGVKGGVGKGTLVACAAQLFAEANQDVAIIDYDLESCGTTREAMRRHKRNNLPVKTVFDHIALHSQGFEDHEGFKEEFLWDITPEYLKDRQLGKIWLLPASDPSRYKREWDVVANLKIPREELLLELTKEMVERIRREQLTVKWILIDCGAGRNPIFSAAFVSADYGYIITTPDESFFDEIEKIKDEHQRRYNKARLHNIYTIVNRITSEEDRKRAQKCEPIGLIPRNPSLEEEYFQNPIDYDLGYDDVTMSVRNCLAASMSEKDNIMIPDDLTIRILPWWSRLVQGQVALQTVNSAPFRIRTMFLGILSGTSSLVTIALITYLIWQNKFSTFESGNKFQFDAPFIIMVLSLGLCIVSIYLLIPQMKKRKLLQHITKLNPATESGHHELLNLLLADPDRALLRWLKQLLNDAQQKEKVRRQKIAK